MFPCPFGMLNLLCVGLQVSFICFLNVILSMNVGEEAEDIAPPGMYGRYQSRPPVPTPAVNNSSVLGSQMFKTPQKASPGEDADGRPAWPQRSSPWKGTPAKQMRVSPLTSWKRSPAYSALEEGMSGHQTPIMDVSPSRSVFFDTF